MEMAKLELLDMVVVVQDLLQISSKHLPMVEAQPLTEAVTELLEL
jgi:hypothetical protein